MKICFVLPKFARRPIGGYKMVFEYANRLVDRGNEVGIIYINESAFEMYKIPNTFKKLGSDILTYFEPSWFKLNRSIIKRSGLKNNVDKFLSYYDIAICTAVDTVEFTCKHFNNNKILYFIQDFENWIYSTDYVINTYKRNIHKLVISKWLFDLVSKYSNENVYLIKNPIDTRKYKSLNDQSNRINHSIAFLFHKGKWKGSQFTIEAIKKLKKLYPDMTVYAFGATKRTNEIPEYINYTYNATQEETIEIYNKVNVFVCTTIKEGYGLTGLEAMSCGAALVSTDYSGVHEYAIDGYNALLSPVNDVDSIVKNVIKIFENKGLRDEIVNNGIKYVNSNFSWEKAVIDFEDVLRRIEAD